MLVLGCSRGPQEVRLTAPFNERTTLGVLTATWHDTGDERSFADGARLDRPERRLQFRVEAQNRLQDRLYIRIGDFELVNVDGAMLGEDSMTVECTLNARVTEGVLRGVLWLAGDQVQSIRGFRVKRFAVPLSERGLAVYREWLLQGRPNQEEAIDREIADYAAAPPCGAPD